MPASTIMPYLARPIIPYITDWSIPDPGVLASASMLFLSDGDIGDLPAVLDRLDQGPLGDIPVMLHLDLINGLSTDEAAIHYVSMLGRIDGIITVKHHLTPVARRYGMLTVVRLFLQDSRAVERGLKVVAKSKPDAVELLPGIAAALVADQFKALGIPLIAGGLVHTPETTHKIIETGCEAVSTTDTKLWEFNQTP